MPPAVRPPPTALRRRLGAFLCPLSGDHECLEQRASNRRGFGSARAGRSSPIGWRRRKKREYNSRVEVYMLSEYAEDIMGTPEERAARLAEPERVALSRVFPLLEPAGRPVVS